MRFSTNGLSIVVGLAALCVCGCGQETVEEQSAAQKDTATYSTAEAALRLPPSLEKRRGEFDETIRAAQSRIREFAEKYEWERHTAERFMDSTVIFDDKADFDRALLHITGSDSELVLPETYCAALENRTLLAVSPELYARVYPEGIEDDSYEKLLTHEIAHRLHIRILSGDENAMGPMWFYEGFALYAADQLKNSDHAPSTEELWRVVGDTERGSYANYAYVFRHFASKAPLESLVEKAGDTDFVQWLRGLEGE
jgi:hypothetical protein